MSQQLYSVEQVAERLGLHVRTVRAYVRTGRLKAVRIGKQYRIARADLEALTGSPVEAYDRDTVRPHRHVDVSSIVEIDALDSDGASRLANTLMAIGNGRRKGEEPMRIETIYDPERARMKVIVVGGLHANAELLNVIAACIEVRP